MQYPSIYFCSETRRAQKLLKEIIDKKQCGEYFHFKRHMELNLDILDISDRVRKQVPK